MEMDELMTAITEAGLAHDSTVVDGIVGILKKEALKHSLTPAQIYTVAGSALLHWESEGVANGGDVLRIATAAITALTVQSLAGK